MRSMVVIGFCALAALILVGCSSEDTVGDGNGVSGTGGNGTGGVSGAGGSGESAGTGGVAGGTGGSGGAVAGTGGATGGSGGAAGDAGGATVCGTRGAAPCGEGQFCDFAAGSNCGADDSGGQCKDKPQMCTMIYMPVCGCDGQSYGNACSANGAGVSVAYEGECAAGSASNDCDPGKVLCQMMTPQCSELQVPSVSGSCYGPCVPIESCACTSADQCPDPGSYTCLMSAGHCTPYL